MHVYPEGMSRCNVAGPPKRDKYRATESYSKSIDVSHNGTSGFAREIHSVRRWCSTSLVRGATELDFGAMITGGTSLDAKKDVSSTDTV